MKRTRHRRFVKHRKEERNPFFTGKGNLSSESPAKGGFFQAKPEISDPSEQSEKEADKVAEQVVNHSNFSTQRSAFGNKSIQRQEKEEEPAAKRIQRQAEKEEEPATKRIQRQAEKEEEPAAKMIQRQAEGKEEEPAAKRIQRQAEEEEPAAKRIQRQAEKEEEPAAKRIQRQAEKEEEEPAAKRIQRQAEEEEEPAAKRIQRQAEEEEEPAAKRIQRQAEEEEEPAAKQIQRQAEEEEETAAKQIQRQAEEEEETAAKQIQRQAEEEEETAAKQIQRQAEKEEEPAAKRIQRQAEEEEEPVQAKHIKNDVGNSPMSHTIIQSKSKGSDSKQILESMIQETKGMGMALPNDILKEMEGEFKTDFSKVRIHIGEKAVKMTNMIQALAFTHGYDIYFNAGKYQPYSFAGKMLLAHELTHVVQQKG